MKVVGGGKILSPSATAGDPCVGLPVFFGNRQTGSLDSRVYIILDRTFFRNKNFGLIEGSRSDW